VARRCWVGRLVLHSVSEVDTIFYFHCSVTGKVTGVWCLIRTNQNMYICNQRASDDIVNVKMLFCLDSARIYNDTREP
jgi:hypothetical protein